MIGKDTLIEAIKTAGPGEYMLPTSDQRGDDYDIACAAHEDDFALLSAAARQKGALLTRIFANGYHCAYILRVPEPDIFFVLAQHSGAWGPWYHVSAYRIHNRKLVYDHNVGGHYSTRRSPSYPTISALRERLRAEGKIS